VHWSGSHKSGEFAETWLSHPNQRNRSSGKWHCRVIADLIVTFIMDYDTHVTLGREGMLAAINGQCTVVIIGRWTRDHEAGSVWTQSLQSVVSREKMQTSSDTVYYLTQPNLLIAAKLMHYTINCLSASCIIHMNFQHTQRLPYVVNTPAITTERERAVVKGLTSKMWISAKLEPSSTAKFMADKIGRVTYKNWPILSFVCHRLYVCDAARFCVLRSCLPREYKFPM